MNSPSAYNSFHRHSAKVHTPPTNLNLQSLDNKRKAYRQNAADHLISCPPTEWLDSFMSSPWSNDYVTQIKEKLKEGPSPFLDDAGWTTLRTGTRRKEEKEKEKDIYAGLDEIVEKIISAAKELQLLPQLSTTTSFQSSPDRTTKSERIGPAPRPDGEFLLHKSTVPGVLLAARRYTGDKAAFSEYKSEAKHDTIIQNEGQVLGGASHIMADDPRRRFINSLSMEDSRTRFWHFSRALICVSDSFDCHECPDLIIKYSLFSAFASEQDHGFDMTIERVHDGTNEFALRFQVGEKYYQTIGKALSESSANVILSRGRRVWTVREWNRVRQVLEGPEMILKDSWIFECASGDQEVQQDIIRRLEEIDRKNEENQKPTDYAVHVKDYMLEIAASWEVVLPGSGKLDRTPDRPKSSKTEPWKFKVDRSGQNSEHVALWDSRNHPSVSDGQVYGIQLLPRKHLRVVFTEVCSTLYDIPSFDELNTCLKHVVEGLWYFCLAGYVHRDISAGNCLWHTKSKRGIISDLEYAKPYAEVSKEDPITATTEFMAIEYRANRYEFLPHRKVSRNFGAPTERNKNTYVFRYNYYHDLESVWWIYIDYILSHVPIARPDMNSERALFMLNSISYKWSQLFNSTDDRHRRGLLAGESEFTLLSDSLHDWRWYEPLIERNMQHGFSLGQSLHKAYEDLEQNEQTNKLGELWLWDEGYFEKEIYDDFIDCFAAAEATSATGTSASSESNSLDLLLAVKLSVRKAELEKEVGIKRLGGELSKDWGQGRRQRKKDFE